MVQVAVEKYFSPIYNRHIFGNDTRILICVLHSNLCVKWKDNIILSLSLKNFPSFDSAWILINVIETELKKLVAFESYFYILIL